MNSFVVSGAIFYMYIKNNKYSAPTSLETACSYDAVIKSSSSLIFVKGKGINLTNLVN